MKKNVVLFGVVLMLGMMTSCGSKKIDMNKDTIVEMKTVAGDIVLKLYKDTPRHRDNFLKLIKDKTLEGTLFHRVIKNFVIQGGDPDSKNAPKGKLLGEGGLNYTVPAEIVFPKYYHKRGALAAAREGDAVNPTKASSSCQFYIVTGKTYPDSALVAFEQQRNENAINIIFNKLADANGTKIAELRKAKDQLGLYKLQQSLFAQARAEVVQKNQYKYTPEQLKMYSSIGGAPHLDSEYTVFGEVVSGMKVVDEIQNLKTDSNDRPLIDVRILKLKVIR